MVDVARGDSIIVRESNRWRPLDEERDFRLGSRPARGAWIETAKEGTARPASTLITLHDSRFPPGAGLYVTTTDGGRGAQGMAWDPTRDRLDIRGPGHVGPDPL